MIDAQTISEALGGKRSGAGYLACCPAHDDHHPSLSIDDGHNGKPVVYCNAGCSQEEVIAALTERGLWPEKDGVSLSREELQTLRERSARLKAEREAEKLKLEEQAGTEARQRWETAKPPNPAHPYLAKKQNKAHGTRQEGDKLLVPLRDGSGLIWALQTIGPDGGKLFSPAGCRTKGLYFSIGQPAPGGPVCIVEGFATGAAIHESTGHPVACAMTAGNLEAVARTIKAKLPGHPIAVCADDDRKPNTEKNPGIEEATKAALAVGGVVAVPNMGKKADFWDVLNEHGADAVRQAIEAARPVQDDQSKIVEAGANLGQPPAGDQERGATMKRDAMDIEVQDWPVMGEAAFHGLAGDFVRLACRNSESDPAAVLATFMVRFGVECGRAPTLHVGDSKHHAQLAAVIVGASSKARKGTSAKPVARLFEDMEWLATTSPGPFSSGEGIIYAVRDPMEKWDEKKQEMLVADPGVSDKRLFVMDEEFAGALASTKREGNTLSMVIRCAWDGSPLAPLTKNNKISATKHHVGWVSHITLDELHRKLCDSEAFNGFANRILWVCAKRVREVAMPRPMPENELLDIRARLEAVLRPTREIECLPITWSQSARVAWCEQHYHVLTQDHPGLVGCVVNRAEAQVVRLAMIYCLLGGRTVIEEAHLESAMAFWNYCERSAKFIFHGRQADPTAEIILAALQQAGALTGRKIHALFDNHLPKAKLNETMSSLVASGHVLVEKIKGKGRPATTYHFQEKPREQSELTPPGGDDQPLNSLDSLCSLGSVEKTPPFPARTGGGDSAPFVAGTIDGSGWLDVQMNVPGGGMKSGPVTVEI